mgnify:CR=1 FL=1
MANGIQEGLLALVGKGPVYIAGNSDDASIARRIEVLRARGPEKEEPKASCNMGWGWGN